MFDEPLFRIVFWLIFGAMIITQIIFSTLTRTAQEVSPKGNRLSESEGIWQTLVRVTRSIILGVFLILSAINAPWISVFSVPFPAWLQVVGSILGLFSLMIYIWARMTIGRQWSSPLMLRDGHRLVTSGPYAHVRHPIYLAMILFTTSLTLVGASWLLIAFLIISIADLLLRIPKEEQMMIDEFGEEYLAYMQRTGSLLPR